jgi:hypothetical protein
MTAPETVSGCCPACTASVSKDSGAEAEPEGEGEGEAGDEVDMIRSL